MTARREPISSRERPAKPALPRYAIVDATVRIMRAEGLHKNGHGPAGAGAGHRPASLYVYVANTAELHAPMLDALLGEVDLTGREAGADWSEQLRALMTSCALVLFTQPQREATYPSIAAHTALIDGPAQSWMRWRPCRGAAGRTGVKFRWRMSRTSSRAGERRGGKGHTVRERTPSRGATLTASPTGCAAKSRQTTAVRWHHTSESHAMRATVLPVRG
ncbi:hypothetical protein [Streptomyces griseoaurantiacus]|jgi:hypothetical protein|uniref:hypothetical protein n=1 Tax=Streptomyces griseoaurantiacus TaxID=68213 RepID=UPI000A74502C